MRGIFHALVRIGATGETSLDQVAGPAIEALIMTAIGLVEDAIMLELVLRELQHELDGYEECDAYRRDEAAQRDLARAGEAFRLITGCWNCGRRNTT